MREDFRSGSVDCGRLSGAGGTMSLWCRVLLRVSPRCGFDYGVLK